MSVCVKSKGQGIKINGKTDRDCCARQAGEGGWGLFSDKLFNFGKFTNLVQVEVPLR